MAEKRKAEQSCHPSRAEHQRDKPGRRRHGRKPKQAHRRAENHRRGRCDRQRDEQRNRKRAQQINHRQQVALRHPVAEPPRGDRTDDVEQPDDTDRPRAGVDREASVDEIGGQMHCNEEQLKAAGEKSEHQEDVAAVAERFRQRLHERLFLRAIRCWRDIHRRRAQAERAGDHEQRENAKRD